MIRRIVVLAAALVMMQADGSPAQQAAEGDSLLVWNATGAGALSSRGPGRMVDAGIGRYSEARATGSARPEITEIADDPNLTKQLKIDIIQTLFQNLNAMLLVFNNMIRAEGGLPPYLPVPITAGTSGGTTDLLQNLPKL